MAAFRDPEWRARALEDLSGPTDDAPLGDVRGLRVGAFPELVGRRVADIASERGCSPLDVMCELALAEDLKTRFRAYIANDDAEAVGQLLT